MTIGARIRAVRESKGVTQTELGKACGVTKQTIFKYENGIITNIPMDNLELISTFLGANPAYLLGWQGDDPDTPSNLHPVPPMQKVPCFSDDSTLSSGLKQQQVEEYHTAPADLDCSFSMVFHGDSMVGSGLRDGDIVYIRSQGHVDNGAIAAVLVNSSEVLLRRFQQTADAILLFSENEDSPPFVFTGKAREQVVVIGLAVGFTHRF